MAAFEWTGERERASELLAARNLTHQKIADSVGIARSTLWEWRRIPEFAARVEEITEENRAETRRIGIADKERRLAALNDRWARMRRVIEERADDPETAEVVEFAVDTGLLRELREIEKQAAVELGQWNEAAPGEATRVDELIREIRAGTEAANLVGEGR
jgi:transcriptional regulator with XRE-family HTH domain